MKQRRELARSGKRKDTKARGFAQFLLGNFFRAQLKAACLALNFVPFAPPPPDNITDRLICLGFFSFGRWFATS